MNLGRGSKRKGRGKVVGNVVSHESKTWFKEDMNGECSGESCIA